MNGTIVSTEWLAATRSEEDIVIVDTRWYHGRDGGGRTAWLESRIPGAVFLDLDNDLSDRSDPSRGRHPLPRPAKFAQTLARVGIGPKSRVIAYDDQSGSIAARLWWMLRWIRGPWCAVLDGGINKWIAENRPLESGDETRDVPIVPPITPDPDPSLVIEKDAVARQRDAGLTLLDARAPKRFRGEEEPIDAQAGHIPGALSAFFMENSTTDNTPIFKSPHQLRERFARLGPTDAKLVACYCGSGVTACHNVLAYAVAGMPMPGLYPGSWSEWSRDPKMPIATGDD